MKYYLPINLFLVILLTLPMATAMADEVQGSSKNEQINRYDSEWERIPFLIPIPSDKGKKREALTFRDGGFSGGLVLKGIVESNGVLTALVNDRIVKSGDVIKDHKIVGVERYKVIVKGPEGKMEISILAENKSARVSSDRLTDK